ncbi:unnamed protein product [Ectocarpus sp. 12 AP-2014]
MRVGLATARALGFVTRRARRGRGPCSQSGAHRTPNAAAGPQAAGPRTASFSATSQGRMLEEFVMASASRSQLGAATVLATQIRGAVCSVGGGDFSLEVEGDGDDDDGT